MSTQCDGKLTEVSTFSSKKSKSKSKPEQTYKGTDSTRMFLFEIKLTDYSVFPQINFLMKYYFLPKSNEKSVFLPEIKLNLKKLSCCSDDNPQHKTLSVGYFLKTLTLTLIHTHFWTTHISFKVNLPFILGPFFCYFVYWTSCNSFAMLPSGGLACCSGWSSLLLNVWFVHCKSCH